MLQSLFRRAEESVDNAIAGVLGRALVAIPFIVAGGFATAGVAIYSYQELGTANGNLAIAALFVVLGLITAAVVSNRMAVPAHSATSLASSDTKPSDGTAANDDPMDRELMSGAFRAAVPLAIPLVARVVLRNLPLVAAIAAAGFVITRQGGSGADASADDVRVQPAE